MVNVPKRRGSRVPGVCALALSLAAPGWAQTRASGEFRVNTYTTGRQYDPRPAMEADGDFVIVWDSLPQDGSGYGTFGQRFAASGAPRGGEFQVNTNTYGPQFQPNAAVGKQGDFVVVWHSSHFVTRTGIVGQRYDASGQPRGGEFLVSDGTTNTSDVFPRVGRAADGSFVAAWERSTGSFDVNVLARRFDSGGNPIGAELVVNSYTTGSQHFSEIGVEANGSFVVVWEDCCGRDGSISAIFGQRFDALGRRLGGEFQVNTYTTGGQFRVSVGVSPVGGFLVTWASYGDGSGTGVFARRFDASGNASGTEFQVNTYTTEAQFGIFQQVAHDGLGNFVVVWEDCCTERDGSLRAVFGQRFDAAGARRGAEFQVNTYTTYSQREATVASDAVGNFVVVWWSVGQDGSLAGIYAQRFGGLGPFALAVDTIGNQVLEPGETVDVRPTWRNFNGAAQTFTGVLSGITGPPGATYTISDAAGDYGTVADGEERLCVNCYEARVSNPNPRPALHWDASVVESIRPDVLGQQERWTLHVGRSFDDVATASPAYTFIETLLHHRLTTGCGGVNFCPSATTAREQISVFVLLAREGADYAPPACVAPMFSDVPAADPFCRFIEELARRGVVSGCGAGNFCPDEPVSRAQIAVFVLRTLDPSLDPPACAPPNTFDDVPETSPYCRWIEELARRGVVGGCGSGNYCPDQPVTREQVAVIVTAAFGLALYGP